MLPSPPYLRFLLRAGVAPLGALVLATAGPGQPPPDPSGELPALRQAEQPPGEEGQKNPAEEKPEGPEAASKAAGGLGCIIGDGAPRYGPEEII